MGGSLPGLDDCGAHQYAGGVKFCVWAPFADTVAVTGDFTNWSKGGLPLGKGSDGCWYGDVEHAEAGQEYKYLVTHNGKMLERNDPRALQLTASEDSSIIVTSDFDWGDDSYKLPPPEEAIIYELHVGTFVRNDPSLPGTFHDVITKLDYLVELGINVIEVMPCNAMWMDRWWGYTPDNIYAVDAAYGGRLAFMQFVQAAHRKGLGVILDVVYNHLNKDAGLDLWQFDGWSEHEDTGGIYFYNDWRAKTPWGPTRPDYGRPEVRRYITDNVRMWLQDCHVDGLRVDSVVNIRNVEGNNNDPDHDLADGWKLLQEINDMAQDVKPGALIIAEDMQGNEWITKPTGGGGAGFVSQWDPAFGAVLREELGPQPDPQRNVSKIGEMIGRRTNDNPLERVVYTESHDTDAGPNGGTRLDEAVAPGHASTLEARRRTALAAALLCTTPGIPMLFQGQEFDELGAFSHYAPLDWTKAEKNKGILTLYQHLLALRSNKHKNTAGLLGSHVDIFQVDDSAKVIAFRRWGKGGQADDVIVVANFTNQPCLGYRVTFPAAGTWWTRFNTDWKGYDVDFTDRLIESVEATEHVNLFQAEVNVPPYGVLIFSQDT